MNIFDEWRARVCDANEDARSKGHLRVYEIKRDCFMDELIALHKKPITGNLYPFLNMSVDEAGIIFLGRSEALCSGDGLAIGNIQDILPAFFTNSESSEVVARLPIESLLLLIQVYGFSSDINKMLVCLHDLTHNEAEVCVVQSILKTSVTKTTASSTDITDIAVGFIDLTSYAQFLSAAFLYLCQKVINALNNPKPIPRELNGVDPKWVSLIGLNFRYMASWTPCVLGNGTPLWLANCPGTVRELKITDASKASCLITDFYIHIINHVDAISSTMWTHFMYTRLQGKVQYSNETRETRETRVSSMRADLFSRLEARDEVVYSASPKKELAKFRLDKYVDYKQFIPVTHDKQIYATKGQGDFSNKLYSFTSNLSSDMPEAFGKNATRVNIGAGEYYMTIFHLLKKTGMLLANTL